MIKFSSFQLNEKDCSWEQVQEQIDQLKNENQHLKAQLEEYTQGGIKILFSGKANAQRIARKVKPRTLREIKNLCIGNEEEKSKNLVIEGDNLKTMATLYQYHGKIDLIITDPPYNTGNKDFRYNDKWNEDPNDEGLGDYVSSDDTSKHTKWMKFMLPRLQMMKQMLKPSGVLAICIDYRELFNLGKMLDEIFGEENRLAIISWQKATVNNLVKHVSVCTEYVLVYAKDKEDAKTNLLPKSFADYENRDNDPLGDWTGNSPVAKDLTPNNKNIYAIQSPFTGELIYPGKDATSQGTDWRNTKTNMKKWLEEYGMEYEERDLKDGVFPALVIKDFKNFADPQQDSLMRTSYEKAQQRLAERNWPKLLFLKKGLGRPRIKRYLKDIKEGKVAVDYWNDLISIPLDKKIGGSSENATHELRDRVNGQLIGVKPLELFKRIIRLWCPSNGLVLDPFAGSGTAGEVVLQLNRERERERNHSFILIEQGFNPKEEDKKEKNWCRTLLQKRLQAVITGKWVDGKTHEALGGGFRFFELTKQVDSFTILRMEKQELIDAILSSRLNYYLLPNTTYLIAKNQKNEGIYLVWNSDGKKRKSEITEEIYCQCVLEQKKHGLASIYHIYARNNTYQTPIIIFYKIPDKILIDFGIDPATDTFVNDEKGK